MSVENGESNEPQPRHAYPTQRDYQRRPRGNICPDCGKRILMTPKQHEYYLLWRSGDHVPLCNDCGVRLNGD